MQGERISGDHAAADKASPHRKPAAHLLIPWNNPRAGHQGRAAGREQLQYMNCTDKMHGAEKRRALFCAHGAPVTRKEPHVGSV